MSVLAPNLTVLVGETVGARLIAHAGSLINLAKHPASTIQILGAEKVFVFIAVMHEIKIANKLKQMRLNKFINLICLHSKDTFSRFEDKKIYTKIWSDFLYYTCRKKFTKIERED